MALPVNLPVSAGDAISAVLCINSQPSGSTVFCGVANETRGQTVNISTSNTEGLVPLSIDAGVTLDLIDDNPTLNKLLRFGVVYFDEISAYTTAGARSLTAGDPVTLTDLNRTKTRESGPAQRIRVQDRLRVAPPRVRVVSLVEGDGRTTHQGDGGEDGRRRNRAPSAVPRSPAERAKHDGSAER